MPINVCNRGPTVEAEGYDDTSNAGCGCHKKDRLWLTQARLHP